MFTHYTSIIRNRDFLSTKKCCFIPNKKDKEKKKNAFYYVENTMI